MIIHVMFSLVCHIHVGRQLAVSFEGKESTFICTSCFIDKNQKVL